MAINNRERIGKAFDLLSEGLIDLVDEVMSKAYGGTEWPTNWVEQENKRRGGSGRPVTKHDVQTQLRAITEQGVHFRGVLSRAQQGFASELRDVRNEWAHGEQFSSDDTARALDTMERLLVAAGSGDSAEDVKKLRLDLQRTVFEDQTRKQVKRSKVSVDPGAGLRPWRDVIRPHDDVARGEFTASEFAADLHLVHTGATQSAEYSDPIEFFNRTYLTEGLSDLLTRSLKRMSGDTNASPVVNLQTNFGGGKTHSMLALYHLFGSAKLKDMPQHVQELVSAAGLSKLSGLEVKRVALVGTYLQPGSPSLKDDGTQVNTLWGELAWQLGGPEAYEIVADADRSGTNPGAALRTLIEKYSPALILIDEWVAYARQLVTDRELPAGSFETQFTFAQSLTEVVRSVPGAMLVVSVPASDSGEAGAGSDIEIGGANGQLALERLQNVIRRVADQWRPSSKDESFEIVRRRLFQNPDSNGLAAIAATARSFVTMYQKEKSSFPREASAPGNEYEKRIRASYPLHPELLDRLYEDWSALERFQRTRGVLKLVSSIVHELWASNDSSPLIMSGNVPLDATTVNTDLTQYLEDQWKPIIDSDIDGPGSTAQQIDLDRANLGQRFVTQRLARTIFMGAAPRSKSKRKGLDKQYVWLGAAAPTDTLGNFGSAIDLLGQRSTYFYGDQGHYWFDTQPSIAKAARDFAERLREDEETVWNEITRRLQNEERTRGVFDRVHIAPDSSADVPDLEDSRLVIVHPRYSRRKQDGPESPAIAWVRSTVESKGSGQRVHRNSLLFLVADRTELENLEAATRSYLGWLTIQGQSESLNLSAQQRKQADEQVHQFNQTVTDRISQTFVWGMYPEQHDPATPFEIVADRIPDSGGRTLAERVGAKLGREDQLVTELGAPILGMTLHTQLAPLWNEKREMTVGELWGYFTRYVYMPRLARREVLDSAIRRAISEVLISSESFAIAAGKEETTGRYQNLILPPLHDATIQVTDKTILVDTDLASAQIESDREHVDNLSDKSSVNQTHSSATLPTDPDSTLKVGSQSLSADTESLAELALVTRFFGSVKIDSERYSRDISMVIKEIVDRLAGTGAKLDITLDIQASKPEGFDESEMRTISENARTLKFDPSSSFE